MACKSGCSWQDRIEIADAKKKVNPLDLSSDQDLTVALMNLMAIDGKLADCDRLRHSLMLHIVKETGLIDVSERLLGAAMRLAEYGTKHLESGQKGIAYDCFDQSYQMYSLFWGVNMGMVDIKDVDGI